MQRLDAADIPAVVALAAAIAWDYGPPEIETALAAGVMVGCKADDGTLLACAGLYPYGGDRREARNERRLTSLGMVMVHPESQGHGLGKRVTQACMAEAGKRPIVLCATDAGRPLYERLGFETIETLHKLIAPQYVPVAQAAHPGLSEAPPAFEEILALDAGAIGASREAFMRARLAQAADRAWLRDPQGRLVGFALGIQSPAIRVIGPVVAPDAEGALALIDTLAGRHAGPLRIDVPSGHEGVIAAVKRRGFTLDRIPPVMALRVDQLPERNGTLFAIAAQAYG